MLRQRYRESEIKTRLKNVHWIFTCNSGNIKADFSTEIAGNLSAQRMCDYVQFLGIETRFYHILESGRNSGCNAWGIYYHCRIRVVRQFTIIHRQDIVIVSFQVSWQRDERSFKCEAFCFYTLITVSYFKWLDTRKDTFYRQNVPFTIVRTLVLCTFSVKPWMYSTVGLSTDNLDGISLASFSQ